MKPDPDREGYPAVCFEEGPGYGFAVSAWDRDTRIRVLDDLTSAEMPGFWQ